MLHLSAAHPRANPTLAHATYLLSRSSPALTMPYEHQEGRPRNRCPLSAPHALALGRLYIAINKVTDGHGGW